MNNGTIKIRGIVFAPSTNKEKLQIKCFNIMLLIEYRLSVLVPTKDPKSYFISLSPFMRKNFLLNHNSSSFDNWLTIKFFDNICTLQYSYLKEFSNTIKKLID